MGGIIVDRRRFCRGILLRVSRQRGSENRRTGTPQWCSRARGLVWVATMEVGNKIRIKNVAGRNPGCLLQTIALPVNQDPSPLPSQQDRTKRCTEKTGPPSMTQRGGGGGTANDRGLSWTDFTLDTWKVGWTRTERGSLSLTAVRLMIFWMGSGPRNLGASFLDSTWRGRSRWGSKEPHFLANLVDWSRRTSPVGQGSIATHGALEGGVTSTGEGLG